MNDATDTFDSTPWVLGAGALLFGGIVIAAAVYGGPPRGKLDAAATVYDPAEARRAIDAVGAAYTARDAAEAEVAEIKSQMWSRFDPVEHRGMSGMSAADEAAARAANARLRDLNAVNRLVPRAPATTVAGRRAEELLREYDAIGSGGHLNAVRMTKVQRAAYEAAKAEMERRREAQRAAVVADIGEEAYRQGLFDAQAERMVRRNSMNEDGSGGRLNAVQDAASLWLNPQTKPVPADWSRWADYPYFIETLEQFGTPVMRATVTWEPYADFTRFGFDDDSDWDFVDEVEDLLRAGEDVPPLVRWDRSGVVDPSRDTMFDGRHRAHAARRLGIDFAPTVYLTYAREV